MLDKNARILLVDDSSLMQKAISNYLKELGYENVVTASDGQEGLVEYNSEKPDFIFLDIVMPNMQGNELLEKIRETDTSTPVVMLSSIDKQSIVDACVELGILGYVLKPINRNDGPEVLKGFLEKV
jgi:YesN/AraC family two-component response regulator